MFVIHRVNIILSLPQKEWSKKHPIDRPIRKADPDPSHVSASVYPAYVTDISGSPDPFYPLEKFNIFWKAGSFYV